MPTNDLSPAAEAFLSELAHWLPVDVLEEARGRLAGLLAEERAEKPPTFRFRALTAVAGETWVPLAWWIDLQPVLAEVAKVAAAAEREACAARLEVLAAGVRGRRKRVRQVDEHEAWVLECAAEKIRRKE